MEKYASCLDRKIVQLPRESLAADIRIETNRRLKSLEGDLERAEQSRKERQYAIKYHKTRIERQKVCRKIKRVKKELGNPSTGESAELKDSLFSLRIDLNYVLHYPKLEKYISLFPSDTSNSSETDARRNELRQQIKIAMERGELDAEPELKMDKGNRTELLFQGGKSHSARSRTIKSGNLTTDAFFETSGDEGH
ncbi:hypothetical protein Clacol_002727 [Clathrus columnatus]|uniref:rRNA-processing protein EFG1 n=1 Tax=Clathrus columnatus TaxID=1419009 RepID=A0AAV5A5I7_9AGAM|nr:hypothetical protein Clacol_002727 [Clathrus columnatus]